MITAIAEALDIHPSRLRALESGRRVVLALPNNTHPGDQPPPFSPGNLGLFPLPTRLEAPCRGPQATVRHRGRKSLSTNDLVDNTASREVKGLASRVSAHGPSLDDENLGSYEASAAHGQPSPNQCFAFWPRVMQPDFRVTF
jgi:hypothetical protein